MRLRDNPILRTHSRPNTPIKMAVMSVVSLMVLAGLCAMISIAWSATPAWGAFAPDVQVDLIRAAAMGILFLVLCLAPVLVSTCVTRGRISGAFEAERLSSMRPVDIAVGYVLGPLRIAGLVGGVSAGVLWWDALPRAVPAGWDPPPGFWTLAVVVLSVVACLSVFSAWFSVATRRPSAAPGWVTIAVICVVMRTTWGIEALVSWADSGLPVAIVIGGFGMATVGAWLGLLRAIRRPPRPRRRWGSRRDAKGSNATKSDWRKRVRVPFPFPSWNNALAQSAWQSQGLVAVALAGVSVLLAARWWIAGHNPPRLSDVSFWWCRAQWRLTAVALLNLLYRIHTHRKSGMFDALRLSSMTRADTFVGYLAVALTPVLGAMLAMAGVTAVGGLIVDLGDTTRSLFPAMIGMLTANAATLVLVAWVSLGRTDRAQMTVVASIVGFIAMVVSVVATDAPAPVLLGILGGAALLWREATVELPGAVVAPLMRMRTAGFVMLTLVASFVALSVALSVGRTTTYVLYLIPWMVIPGVLVVFAMFVATLEPKISVLLRAARGAPQPPWWRTGPGFAVLCTLVVTAPGAVVLGRSAYTPATAFAWAITILATMTFATALIDAVRLDSNKLRLPPILLVVAAALLLIVPGVAEGLGAAGTEHWRLGWALGPATERDVYEWENWEWLSRPAQVVYGMSAAGWLFTALQALLAGATVYVWQSTLARIREQVAARGAGAGVR